MYSISIDETKLHQKTVQVVMTHKGIVEVDERKDAIVTHHYLGNHILLDMRATPRAMPMQTAYPGVSPEPKSVKYNQPLMKQLYTKLGQAAGRGSGDICAEQVRKLLREAEID